MVSNNIRRKNLNFMYRLVSYQGGGIQCKIGRDPQYKRYDVSKFSINVVYMGGLNTRNMLKSLVRTLSEKSEKYVVDMNLHTFYFKNGSRVTVSHQQDVLRISC